MREKAKLYALVSLIVIAFMSVAAIASFFYGRSTKESELENKPLEVTNQIVVDRITNQYFVVSKTVFLDTTSEIKISENSDWSDILWKKTLVAEAIIRVDVGVDMQQLDSNDIEIDRDEKTITLVLPKATILDSSLYSELEVDPSTGIITGIADLFKDGTEDYNLAVTTLTDQAQSQVEADEELLLEAEDDAIWILKLILKDTGYEIYWRFE